MKEILGIWYENYKMPIGTKIKFEGEKQMYTVRASNIVFAICTKPMNALKTVLYTIIDWNEQIRGTENLVFGMGAETDEHCNEMLERMTQGESEISHRNNVKLKIEKIEFPKV